MASSAPKVKKENAPELDAATSSVTFSVTVETWRFYAYLSFWFVCFFAMALNNYVVAPLLKKGSPDGSACGPFNRNDPDYGVFYGKGFDVATQSHLNQFFGFNNICINWDYSPSRELTSIVYPAFEYSLLIYLVLDIAATTIANKRGELEPWFWTFSKIVFPINFFLCAQFRQIFVNIAYQNVKGHTAGFLGLQIALILVAIQNTLFIYDTNTAYEVLGSTNKARLRRTRTLACIYIIGNLLISIPKVIATIYCVQHGVGAAWTMKQTFIPGMKVGQVVDRIWMLFNAVFPLLISYFRSKNEQPLKFVISQDAAPYVLEEQGAGENAPLVSGVSA